MACWCAQKVLCVSPSLEKKVLELRICKPHKLAVLGSGSCAGVHFDDYRPTPGRLAVAKGLRQQLGIPFDAPVLGFIGRLTKDKGIVELLQAFSLISQRVPAAHLLLVGPFEDGDPVPEETRREIAENPRIRHVEWVDDPRPFLHLMSVFVLPTHREGLPGVLLEASAAETPVVATRATGVVDVVVNEQTGLVSEIGDAASLADNTLRLLLNPALEREFVGRARQKVEAEFSREQVLRLLESFYHELCVQSGVRG
jgi:glycosyltransferase involved in cell wall biosynthesis